MCDDLFYQDPYQKVNFDELGPFQYNRSKKISVKFVLMVKKKRKKEELSLGLHKTVKSLSI